MQVKQAIESAKDYSTSVIIPYMKGTALPYVKEQLELGYLLSIEAYDIYKPVVIAKACHYYQVALATYGKYEPIVKGWVANTAIPQLKATLTFLEAYLEAFIVNRMESTEGPLEEPTEGLKSVMVQMVKTDFKAAVKTAKWAISEVLIAIGEVIFPYGLV
jgi:hypothetical protein